MSQYLGDISAYALAVSQGYTGTEEEYAELMASYATVGQTAVTAAQTATTKASEAATSATTATNKASEATTAAQTATTKAQEAVANAEAAARDASQAMAAESTATSKATEATTAAATATSAASTATTAKDDAVSAKTAAQTAQAGAETAAASVQSSAARIQTNADDISELKEDFATMESDGVVPSAEQIISDKYIEDSVPYHYRKTGGNGSDREYVDAIVGGTVNWNQLIQNGNFESTTGWGNYNDAIDFSVSNNVFSMTVSASKNSGTGRNISYVKGHKYLKSVCVKSSVAMRFDIDGVFGKQSTGSGSWEVLENIADWSSYNTGSFTTFIRRYSAGDSSATAEIKNVQVFDLTAMFGAEIADYIYSLEQANTGAGVAFFKSLFPNDYYEYNSGELVSVSGVSAHAMRDADDNIIRSYPLDSSLTLRGLFKLDANNNLYADGDTYEYTGKVTRNTILRAYQSGDESLANAITDGTNTVVYSANASTEEADPYQHLQQCDPNGTEEYVSTGIVPIGHNSFYPENLRAKVEQLPWNFANLIAPTESTYTATRNYTTGSLFIVDNVLYKATSNIANGGSITPNTNCTATTLAEIISALA